MAKEDIAYLFAARGVVSFRRMFGGTAIFVGGRIVGMELDGDVLLKGDLQTRHAYESGGLKQWGYHHAKTGKPVMMPYWVLPPEALDDHDRIEGHDGLGVAARRRRRGHHGVQSGHADP